MSNPSWWGRPNARMPVTPTPARHGHPWSPQEVAQLHSMLRNHMSVNQIAAELKRFPTAIEYRIAKEQEVNHTIVCDTTDDEPVTRNARIHHLITLLQEGYTTCQARFAVGGKTYTYKLPLDMGVKVGDSCVVDVSGDLKVVEIAEIDAEPVIDIRTPYALRWVVCKVDRARYDEQMIREEQAAEELARQERKNAKAKALEQLLGLVDVAALKAILGGTK